MRRTDRPRGVLRAPSPRRQLGRLALTATERFLGTFSPPFVLLLGLLLMALIGVIDAVTGQLNVVVIYLVPVGLVTYARGRWLGTLMAGVAALAWTGIEVAEHATALDAAVTYWDTLTRFYIYEALVVLVGPMRDVVLWEREIAGREVVVADRLRNVNALRASLETEGGAHLGRLEAMVDVRGAAAEAEISRHIARPVAPTRV